MALLRPGANVWQIAHADRFAVLVDGAAFFAAVRGAARAAQHSIFIMGWDFDSRTRLVNESGCADDGLPADMAGFLGALVRKRPNLQIHLLLWDFSLLYATEREPLPRLTLPWKLPAGVRFRLDNQVPFGASQHQKIVVIDDSVAFSGGLDLTGHRWDTPSHDIANPWRIMPNGKPYRPFHDVQAMVDGSAARALSQIVRERWRCVSGEELPCALPSGESADVWPTEIEPDFKNIGVGIARTQPAMEKSDEIREVERLFLDSIDVAERWLYIENQFFTSNLVAKHIAARMQARPELETLLIGPQNHESWVEARTMRNGRIRFMRTLADAGVSERVRLLYPHVENAGTATDTMMHSKVMIIDDGLLRVGSANLNNRSMGTDTECDLAVEANSAEERAQILSIRHRLLADHCGVPAAEVARFSKRSSSLLQAAQHLSGRGHSLRAIDDGEPDPEEMARYVEAIADPEKPVGTAVFASMDLSGFAVLPRWRRMARSVANLLGRIVRPFRR